MKQTIVISGFPGVGKSYFMSKAKEKGLVVLDSDSSKFSWKKDVNGNNTKEREPRFPQNYIEHIRDNIFKADIILVSSHENVRQALRNNNINYYLVYPEINLKDEYIQRYKKRGNDESFIKFIDSSWDAFITAIEAETFPTLIPLKRNEYLGDLFKNGFFGGDK